MQPEERSERPTKPMETNENIEEIEKESAEEDDEALPATFATVKIFSDKKKERGHTGAVARGREKGEPHKEAVPETTKKAGRDTSAQKMTQRRAIFDGFTLKMIAVVTMLIDHAAIAFLADTWSENSFSDPLYTFYFALRLIGRFAFPLFCFVLVEGFFHTRSRLNYAIRLAVFAILSEVPFDLALSSRDMKVTDRLLNWKQQNVFFTLLLGFLVIWAIEWWMQPWVKNKKPPRTFGEISKFFLPMLGFIIVGALVAVAIRPDYKISGVVAIVFIYFAHGEAHPGMNMVRSGLILAIAGGAYTELIVPAGYPLTEFYSEKRGRNWKWFFYVFYPAHLLLLFGLQQLLK